MKLLVLLFVVSFGSIAGFDHTHSAWSEVLSKYTSKSGNQTYFHYKELKKNKELLNAYLAKLESLTPKEFETFGDKQKLAFWINAYNAHTVKIVLKHYPVESIKDIGGGLFSSGPWKMDFINLFGKKMSLDDIEHGTIRKKFDEPRIHFAVNCASIGCPSLLTEAFTGASLEKQLDAAANNFLNNKSKNFVKGDTLYLSKIFKWYGDDFEKKHGSFKKYVVKTLGLPDKNYDVEFLDYNWDLNEKK